MAERSPAVLPEDEHDLYPVHEEDSVPEIPAHYRQSRYLAGGLQAYRSDLWVTGETCLYWEQGNTHDYAAPDVAVIQCPPPRDPPRIWLAWVDAPLMFVAEIGSKSTFRTDTGPKLDLYARLLRAPEYLYADPPTGDLRFWRLAGDRYHPVRPGPDGRIASETLGVAFGYDGERFLRIYTPEGETLLTHEEAERARAEAERRAAAAARRANAEARRRAEAERRMADLTAELERLRQARGEA